MLVLGIDSATLSGWSVVDVSGCALVEYGMIRVSAVAVRDFVEAWAPRVSVVVIEDQFLSVNVKVVKTLAQIEGRWMQEFEVRGVRTESVFPQQWQTGLLKGLASNKSKRDVRKKAAQTWVKSVYGLICTEDEADAICIAAWRARTEKHTAKA